MKRVRCIDPSVPLFAGQIYTVASETPLYYYLSEHLGRAYLKDRFIDVDPEFQYKVAVVYIDPDGSRRTYLLEGQPSDIADHLQDAIQHLAKYGGEMELSGINPACVVKVPR